jgi:GAF domain-containing protein
MNTDRLLREVETRLARLGEADRQEVLDAVREEIARERRRVEPELTVEAERGRRVEAETLREVLESINRPSRLSDTIGEVLKQLERVVAFDFAALAWPEPAGGCLIIAERGVPDGQSIVGTRFDDPLSQAVLEERWPLNVADVNAEERFRAIPGAPPVRSWAGIPLLVEGDVIGLLYLGRAHPDPFVDEDLHRAKAVAFSAAAAIRKAQLLEQVHRYAALMEQVVEVDQKVFAGAALDEVARAILDGAGKVGSYKGGLLILQSPRGPVVAAASGEGLAGTVGRPAPPDLAATAARRLPAARMIEVGESLGVVVPAHPMFLVPLSTVDGFVGTLALVDPDGETPDDRLMEAYGSRAAAAYRHAAARPKTS